MMQMSSNDTTSATKIWHITTVFWHANISTMQPTFQGQLPQWVNIRNGTQVYPQLARQMHTQQKNPTGYYIYYADEQQILPQTQLQLLPYAAPTQGSRSPILPPQVHELWSQLVTPLQYSTGHASLDSAPGDSTAPAIVSPQFPWHYTVFFQIKRMIQSSTRNSILGIYGWIQLRVSCHSLILGWANLAQYQEWGLSVVPVSLFCGNKGQSRTISRKVSYNKYSSLALVRIFGMEMSSNCSNSQVSN